MLLITQLQISITIFTKITTQSPLLTINIIPYFSHINLFFHIEKHLINLLYIQILEAC